MPVSDPTHIPAVLHFACGIEPKRILDVGIGMGAYGFLLRQYLEICQGRLNPAEWQVEIDGIDIFEGYRNPVWAYAYNQITVGDVREIADLETYDLILCNDVLEHLPRHESLDLVRQLLSRGRVLLATSPHGEYPQGAHHGNEAERHLSTVTAEVFPGLILTVHVGATDCYVCTLDGAMAKRIRQLARTCPRIRSPRFPVRAGAGRLWRWLTKKNSTVQSLPAARESGA